MSYYCENCEERGEAAEAEIERLRAQVARLTRMLDDPGTTHAEGCATWGPKHWQCALNERDALRASLTSEKECQGAFVIRVLGQEDYDNSPCQAHPLELVENEIERLRAEVGHWREANRASLTAGDVLKDEVVRLTAENDWLRAYTAQSAKDCVYCGLGADEQGECNRGFPGCARADDQMLCREVEVAMERDELLARVEAAEAQLRNEV